ncbi:MAG: TetR/AcrR family transcriptional regulator [Bacteroidota bacterium]|nr:TetR/AcrR family transcriptional regulator [Bacteroidota bacterium]
MQTDRQKEIVNVALKLISEKGIQGFTIKNLSKEIGITEPAIYRHFENKIQILITILESFKENTKKIFASEEDRNEKAIEKIGAIFSMHFNLLSNRPELVSIIFAEEIFRNEAILTKMISEIIKDNEQVLCKIIMEGQNNNELRKDVDAKYLSTVIMGSLRLFVKKWQFSNNSYNLVKDGKQFTESIKLLILK